MNATGKQARYIKDLTSKMQPTDWPYPYDCSPGHEGNQFEIESRIMKTTNASIMAGKISNSCENMTTEEASIVIDWLLKNAGTAWSSSRVWLSLLEDVPRLGKLLTPTLKKWEFEASVERLASEIYDNAKSIKNKLNHESSAKGLSTYTHFDIYKAVHSD